jgi:hypothetical protein
MARYGRKTRKSYGKKGRTLKKRQTVKAKKMRGGGVKEDALAVIKNNGYTNDDFTSELYKNEHKKTLYVMDLDGFTFKGEGSVRLSISAKPIGAADSAYELVYVDYDK